MYTVIAKEPYCYCHTDIFCLGTFSTLELASKAIKNHRLDNGPFDYHTYSCEVDQETLIESLQELSEEKERQIRMVEYKNIHNQEIDHMIKDEKKKSLEIMNDESGEIEEIDDYEIDEYRMNISDSKAVLLNSFNTFLDLKELVHLYSTNIMEYYQSYTLNIVLRYNKIIREWTKSNDVILLIIREKINEDSMKKLKIY
jgi:hypothetical protein